MFKFGSRINSHLQNFIQDIHYFICKTAIQIINKNDQKERGESEGGKGAVHISQPLND